jgi:hypothetical protein
MEEFLAQQIARIKQQEAPQNGHDGGAPQPSPPGAENEAAPETRASGTVQRGDSMFDDWLEYLHSDSEDDSSNDSQDKSHETGQEIADQNEEEAG